MAQDPFKSDQIQILGDSETALGDRLLRDDPLDGSLQFVDPRVPSGVNLTSLAGLQQLARTIIVSPSGIGASKDEDGDPITTIQRALDAVPSSADDANPWTILVGPGLYIEDVLWVKDSVSLVGLGKVTLRGDTTSPLRIVEGLSTIPRNIAIRNIRLEGVIANEACVDVLTSTFAFGTLDILSIPNVGDSVTVGGVLLTAIANGSVPAPGEFELGTTEDETADNLATAINDPVNGLVGVVVASALASLVTIRASQPGVAGNAITLVSSVPLVMLPSGATFAGGQDTAGNSQVGLTRILVTQCELVASATPSYQVRASAVNYIEITDCDLAGSSAASILDIRNCAGLEVVRVRDAVNLEIHYDSGAAELPVILTSSYSVEDLASSGTVNSELLGVGSLTVSSSTLQLVFLSGDRPWSFTNTSMGPLQVGGASPSVTLSNCSRGVLTGFGVGTLAESRSFGVLTFAASVTESVVFPVPTPDTLYTVVVEQSVAPATVGDIPTVLNKTVTGFDVVFGTPQNSNFRYVVYRDI